MEGLLQYITKYDELAQLFSYTSIKYKLRSEPYIFF